MLAAGANAYLGALWKVDDLATMMHMYLFYTVFFAALNTPSLTEAWQIATRMLYDLTVEKKAGMLESILKCWDVWDACGENPHAFVQRGRGKLEAALARLREDDEGGVMLNFKRPFVWAAFALVGDGSMRIQSSLHGMLMGMTRGETRPAAGASD